jgi:nucleoside-diphosphate-sugar epimerase
MTSTLITGGLGYLGRNVVARLASAGEPVVSYNRDFAVSELDGVTCVQGELYDLPRLVDTLGRYDVGRIVHTAAMSHPELSVELPITTVTANVDGTLHVFEAARMAGVKRIVNFSSECAYGHVEGPVREDAALRPTTPYGVTKVATELLGHVYTDLYGLDVVSLRPTELYGPGNKMPQYLREMIRAALDGEPYRLESGADQRFHFVHVDDVARATELAANAPSPRQRVYNITGGVHVRLAEAAGIVRAAIPDADIEVGPGLLDLDQQGPYDISAAAAELGYEPQWSLEAGLNSYIDHLRENRY